MGVETVGCDGGVGGGAHVYHLSVQSEEYDQQ